MINEYLKKVKKRLYIVSAYYDDEIKSLIEAARIDMTQSGVKPEKVADENDDFVLSAVTAFVKAHRSTDADESRLYMGQYSFFLSKLTLTSEYGNHSPPEEHL